MIKKPLRKAKMLCKKNKQRWWRKMEIGMMLMVKVMRNGKMSLIKKIMKLLSKKAITLTMKEN